MDFTGHEDHSIPLSDAAELTSRYRSQMRVGDLKGGFFGKDAIQAILDQTSCVGIRFYYGLDRDNKQMLVLVGTKADNNDLVNGELAEFSLPCPDFCGEPNELNS